jgi:alcohol oxidase
LPEVSITFHKPWYWMMLICAGGTAACVIAGRMAEAFPGLSILVIEQGPNNLDVPTVVHPALFMAGLLPTSNATLYYEANPEKQLANRKLVVPSGGTLGGGSSINLMMYSRAQRSDFNAWNVPGWAAKDMIPYMQKVCTVDTASITVLETMMIPFSLRHTTDRDQRLYMDTKDL